MFIANQRKSTQVVDFPRKRAEICFSARSVGMFDDEINNGGGKEEIAKDQPHSRDDYSLEGRVVTDA
jgi:hypothetical protein